MKREGCYKEQEKEILLVTHSIFHIERIGKLSNPQLNKLEEVHLALMGYKDKERCELTEQLLKELSGQTE